MSEGMPGKYDDPWLLALKIQELAEIGSHEFEPPRIIMDVLRSREFSVVDHCMGIPTAFRAEKVIGSGKPVVAFLAEYDALTGIGHACGHNLIASAAVFSGIRAAENVKDGRIIVIGTPR